MGILKRLKQMFNGPSIDPRDSEPAYKCIQCGTTFERDVRTCDSCGSNFVAPIDGK